MADGTAWRIGCDGHSSEPFRLLAIGGERGSGRYRPRNKLTCSLGELPSWG